MKWFNWFSLGKDRGTQSAHEFLDLAMRSQKVVQEKSETRQRESLERDLLYINGLMRHVDGPPS